MLRWALDRRFGALEVEPIAGAEVRGTSPASTAGSASRRRAGPATRPTADRVREALFSILGPVAGLRVLDLYAGSGALGIEALSRGAAEATFVDSDPAALRAVRDEPRAARRRRSRASSAPTPCRSCGAPPVTATAGTWSCCDPPYRLAPRLGPALGPLLAPVLEAGARIVCESSVKQPLRLDLPLLTERRYGDTA